MGGREGNNIYYSKPIIYNDDEKDELKYMYPNIARQEVYIRNQYLL